MGVRGTELFDEVDARLGEIKRLFLQLATDPASGRGAAASPMDRLELARLLLWGRTLLEREVAADLFADPALNILLTLYVSGEEKREVSTSAACVAAGVPTTTALRWINALTGRGMIQKRSLPNDRRFTYLELSTATRASLGRFFDLILDRAANRRGS